MKCSRFLLGAALGAVVLQASASAAPQLNNIQVYRWGYVDQGSTRLVTLPNTWSGVTYDDYGSYNQSGMVGTARQAGAIISPGTSIATYGGLSTDLTTITPDTTKAQNSVSTRFTLTEAAPMTISGEANARITNGMSSQRLSEGTMWSRVRLMDFVTGQIYFSRIARADLIIGNQGAFHPHPFNQTITIPAGRYNLITDSWIESNTPSIPSGQTAQVISGWDLGGVSLPDPSWAEAWAVQISVPIAPPPGALIPEPASLIAVGLGLPALLMRKRC